MPVAAQGDAGQPARISCGASCARLRKRGGRRKARAGWPMSLAHVGAALAVVAQPFQMSHDTKSGTSRLVSNAFNAMPTPA